MLVASATAARAMPGTIKVSTDRLRAEPGTRVEVTVEGSDGQGTPDAVVLRPGGVAIPLALTAAGSRWRADVLIERDALAGLHVVHVWSGPPRAPRAVGKAVIVVRPLVLDFAVPSYLDAADVTGDLDGYLRDFQAAGGNMLVAHNLVVPDGAYYPSDVARRRGGPDLVELILDRADRAGLAVLLSVSWDRTRTAPYSARFAEVTALIDELYGRYAHHPSMVGFYSWQEGSGTYYAGFVRAFSDHVKARNATLVTACAPHIDDPLLAGYLSVVESLDVIIYQSGTMASYRPDNRKKYPIRRVRDFCSLGAGAARLQRKIALSHVEMFGYLETRTSEAIVTTTPGNITRQILSAATVPDADGISLFTYVAHIHAERKRHAEVERSRTAVREALRTFRLLSTDVSAAPNPLAVYIPYSDWVIERWTTSFLPAFDAFRLLGVPVDVLPWAPRLDESILPYYPIQMNEGVLNRLLAERVVLVLPDVSGLQQTDSDLIDAFVKAGGVIVLFGPQLPMGRTFDRRALIGADELPGPSWRAVSATVLARSGGNRAAAWENRYGRGRVYVVARDALSAARQSPRLVRDVLDRALAAAGHPKTLTIDGTTIDTDVAVRRDGGRVRAAIVNLGREAIDVVVRDGDARLPHRVAAGAARVIELGKRPAR